MKTKTLSTLVITIVGALAMLFFGIMFTACGKVSIEKINVIKGDCDFLYFQGDKFDEIYSMTSKSVTNVPNIEVVYSNGNKKIVTYENPNLTFSGYNREGNYDNFTKKFNDMTIIVEYTENGKTVSTSYDVSMTFNRGTKILKQPQSAVVSYPNGTSFSVEVEDPEENAVQYQWQVLLNTGTGQSGGGFGEELGDINDFDYENIWGKGQQGEILFSSQNQTNEIIADTEFREYIEYWYDIEGTEGTKSTFNLKAVQPTVTARPDTALKLRCLITNKYGETTTSDVATIVINNIDEFVPCVYIGDFAIKAGETLDLSTTNCGTNSGKISLAENGYEITLENVNFSNEYRLNSLMTSGIGLELLSYNNLLENYIFHIKGTNTFKNIVYQPAINSAGIPICCNFMSASVIPTVKFIGEANSKLIIEGGTELIYSNSEVIIENCDMQLTSSNIDTGMGIDNVIGNGIKCKNLTINNSVFDCNLNGAFIILSDSTVNPGDIVINNSSITGISTISRVGAGATVYNLIKARGDITFDKTSLNLTIRGDKNRLNPGTNQKVGNAVGVSGENVIFKNNSDIKLTVIADDCYILDYETKEVYNYIEFVTGVSATTTKIENSRFSMEADAKAIINLQGISTPKLDITNSNIDISTKARGMVQGIRVYKPSKSTTLGNLTITNSNVDIETFAYDDYDFNYSAEPESTPLYCTNLDIELTTPHTISVKNLNDDVPAIKVKTGNGTEPVNYVKGYVPTNISLTNCDITTPTVMTINQYSEQIGEPSIPQYVYYETFYDASLEPKVASYVVIEFSE